MSKFTMKIEELWKNTYTRQDKQQPEYRNLGLNHEATAKQLYENPDIDVDDLALFDFMMSRPYAVLRGGRPGITRTRRYLNRYKFLFNKIKREGFHGRVTVIKVDGKHVIRDGHRRLNTARTLGVTSIPVREI